MNLFSDVTCQFEHQHQQRQEQQCINICSSSAQQVVLPAAAPTAAVFWWPTADSLCLVFLTYEAADSVIGWGNQGQ
jgi:hypothetical protein